MPNKLDFLRAQVAAYWRDAEAQTDEGEAQRLIMLAVRCQEMILELESGIKLSPVRSFPDFLGASGRGRIAGSVARGVHIRGLHSSHR